ncbi:hypothetical protein B0H11DRAFT_2188281 [Mycena galericulata]|nr:hypothetical protein B0H11DRAFT_2188281 [Mycena galericulata]
MLAIRYSVALFSSELDLCAILEMSGPANFRTDAACKHPLEPDFTTPVFAPSKRLHRFHASVPTQRADTIIHLESCATIATSYDMLSRIKCGEDDLRGLAILGNINEKNI